MKKSALICALIACLILPTVVLVTSAHSGRTDGSGGHINHSTGKYHYHHGYSAHDHYDMDGDGRKDCPYDFDDQTDHSNRGSSNSIRQTESQTIPVISPVVSKKITLEDIFDKVPLIILALIVAPVIVLFVCLFIPPINFVIGKLIGLFRNEDKGFNIVMGIIVVCLQIYLVFKIVMLK